MGGQGSGRWYRWNKKATAEAQLGLDIRWLKKHGCLFPGKFGKLIWSQDEKQTGAISYYLGTDQMILKYRYRSCAVEQVIVLDKTRCNYGGHRKWFLCPQCNRRIAVLYGVGKYFLCRHCHNLTYASQQKNREDRLLWKAQKIRQRLGGTFNVLEPFPEKPKWMHHKTYFRLWRKAEEAWNGHVGIISQKMYII